MGMMNEAPSSERVQIGFFGMRNAGKSSIVNAVAGQSLSLVSDTPGTTTDPVRKSMELAPLGPVVLIDTPGLDDTGPLGSKRASAARAELYRVDIAVLVVDGIRGMTEADIQLARRLEENRVPYLTVFSKADLPEFGEPLAGGERSDGNCGDRRNDFPEPGKTKEKQGGRTGDEKTPQPLAVSARTGWHIRELKERIAELGRKQGEKIASQGLLDGLISRGDLFLLVIPQDASAPKGRLILPEQMTIHEILDHGGAALCCQPAELASVLSYMFRSEKRVRMVITDSQAFGEAARQVPEEIPLTSFSILMARYKGVLDQAAEGVRAVDTLHDGDVVLMSEGCTHHRQCQDIGTVKIPGWLKAYTGKQVRIETSSGSGFPEDLRKYHMVIHCGGCMLGEKEVQNRMRLAGRQGVPFTNYGTVIAYMKGILARSMKALKQGT